uniref:HVA22-like protein n=1 Tax=Rhizophora mucronata TaxID=61149 RepID=A0A2P2JZZ8_RHIMU
MLFNVLLSSSEDVIRLVENILLPRNVPHPLNTLWVRVKWSDEALIYVCCPIEVWQHQPACHNQLDIRPNWKAACH